MIKTFKMLLESKEDWKEILDMKYEDFVKELSDNANDPRIKPFLGGGLKDGKPMDEKVKFNLKSIPCKNLKPTQNEIDVDKSLSWPLQCKVPNVTLESVEGNNVVIKAPIVTLNGKYILDGHHRWSQIYCMNKDATMQAYDITLNVTPIEMLKILQMSIAEDIGYVPVAVVEGKNLLKISINEIEKYIDQNISNSLITIFTDSNKIAEQDKDLAIKYIIDNVKMMKKTSQPIKGAPSRNVMPQTDEAGNWDNTLKKGDINFKEPLDIKESDVLKFEDFIKESENKYKNWINKKAIMTFKVSGNKHERDVKILDYYPKTNIFQVEDLGNPNNEYMADPEQLKLTESEVINELGINDIHYKNIIEMYDKGGNITKSKIGVYVCGNHKISKSELEKELQTMSYEDILDIEKELNTSVHENVNEGKEDKWNPEKEYLKLKKIHEKPYLLAISDLNKLAACLDDDNLEEYVEKMSKLNKSYGHWLKKEYIADFKDNKMNESSSLHKKSKTLRFEEFINEAIDEDKLYQEFAEGTSISTLAKNNNVSDSKIRSIFKKLVKERGENPKDYDL